MHLYQTTLENITPIILTFAAVVMSLMHPSVSQTSKANVYLLCLSIRQEVEKSVIKSLQSLLLKVDHGDHNPP